MQDKRGFIDFEDLNMVALGLGILAGFIGVIIADRMAAGLFIKLAAFVINTVAAYIIANKIAGD